MSQQRYVKSKGKTYLVNTPTLDDGIGAGFAVGQLVMKNVTDGKWYVTYTSGSSPSASLYVSQSALPFASGPIYQQYANTASIVGYMDYFEQNFPFQIVASNNGLAYQTYLNGTTPNVQIVVSQSAYCSASIIDYRGAVIMTSKPFLLLQSVTDGNYYQAGLTTTGGVTSLTVHQTLISQSWIHPVY